MLTILMLHIVITDCVPIIYCQFHREITSFVGMTAFGVSSCKLSVYRKRDSTQSIVHIFVRVRARARNFYRCRRFSLPDHHHPQSSQPPLFSPPRIMALCMSSLQLIVYHPCFLFFWRIPLPYLFWPSCFTHPLQVTILQ